MTSDEWLNDKLHRLRKAEAEMNSALADVAQHSPSDIKVSVDVIEFQRIGHQYPIPRLDVKVAKVQIL